jgi:hypothetical protein
MVGCQGVRGDDQTGGTVIDARRIVSGDAQTWNFPMQYGKCRQFRQCRRTPWVFSGSTPSRAMLWPPARKSLASPMPQNPSASIQDRQLNRLVRPY